MAKTTSNQPSKGNDSNKSGGDQRAKAIELTVATIEKQFGKGAIMRMGDGQKIADIPTIPTGSIGLDIALGIAGCRAVESSRCTVRSPPARPP